MRWSLLIAGLAACGGPSRPPVTTRPPPPDATMEEPPALVSVAAHALWLPVACAGSVEGVGGGRGCLDEQAPVLPATGCSDARGAVMGVMAADDAPADFVLGGAADVAGGWAKTDPRDKRTHEVDLDGDGTADTIALVPHDNRASYGRSLVITDGHDPLMSDAYDPFPDAADLRLLGTSDVDGDGRRELILYAPDEEGFGIAVQEYWAPAEAYRLDCRNP